MPQLDELIAQAKADVESAQKRLSILTQMKKDMAAGAHVSTEEAARQLGQKVRTIPVWCTNGKLEGKKVGRRWLVSQASIDKILEVDR